MDQTHSELPISDPVSDALRSMEELQQAIKDNPQPAKKVLAQNAQLGGELARVKALILDTAMQTARDDIHTVVDHSTSDSMEIDPIILNEVRDSQPKKSTCPAGTVVPLQAALPRRPLLSPMVSPTPMNGRNKSALVIEYDKSLSRMFTAFLKSDHYLVRTAYKSEDALRLYGDCGPFEVVLIDYRMPKKNGIDIALDILKQDPTQPTIIIAPEYRSEDEVPRRNELMNIPFLLEMSNSRLRKVLERLQPWATREEVDRAITALTTAQLSRLQRYGDALVRFSQGADHRTGEDLLQEALRLTLEGKEDGGNGRRWNKRVTLETYLAGAIKSISRRRKGDSPPLEYDTVRRDVDGQEFSLLDNVAACDIPADQRLITEERFNRILGMFKDDPEAVLVLQSWSEGMKRNQIMQEHGLSEKQYRAAVKRIRMKLLSPTNGGGGRRET
jgi:CheY-like chemotaxis protein